MAETQNSWIAVNQNNWLAVTQNDWLAEAQSNLGYFWITETETGLDC
jgi:hypothetical protein